MVAAGFKFRKIKSQPLLGQKLIKARRKLRLSLEDIESMTKIRLKYLEALEEGNYRILPSNVYVLGFLNNYATLLKLDPKEISEAYLSERRSFGQPQESLLKDSGNKLKERSVIITSRTFIWPAVVASILLVASYIFYQVSGFAAAPKLEISSPNQNLITSQDEVLFEGNTDQGANLSINGQAVTVAEDGHFKEDIKLLPGLNTVEVAAHNKNKKETKRIWLIEVRSQTALK